MAKLKMMHQLPLLQFAMKALLVGEVCKNRFNLLKPIKYLFLISYKLLKKH